MPESQAVQSQISSYISKFLKDHFGENPEEMEVQFHPPYLLIHLNGFLLPPEKMLLDRQENKRVLESRDLMMNSLKNDFLEGLGSVSDFKGKELFFDWNLEKQSALLLVIAGNTDAESDYSALQGVLEGPIKDIIEMNSSLTQKKPEKTELFWLNSDILLIKRTGILVEIEKQLIKNGAADELKLAKRPLEYRITKFFNLDHFLPSPVEEIFVDWDFHQEYSYMVLILKRSTS
ncbi:Na-translocating system protein MpsC family protein [Planomicrobium okeanokoites]|uniref:Na-translocating system protein MpsC family protein n=1 Tax=Planomicrobium okeanokoites TaxID=244 RepID=UPI00248F6608|nr:Na-translocating system protein MpsC family protein [Planomicrobium okeanokoites]